MPTIIILIALIYLRSTDRMIMPVRLRSTDWMIVPVCLQSNDQSIDRAPNIQPTITTWCWYRTAIRTDFYCFRLQPTDFYCSACRQPTSTASACSTTINFCCSHLQLNRHLAALLPCCLATFLQRHKHKERTASVGIYGQEYMDRGYVVIYAPKRLWPINKTTAVPIRLRTDKNSY